MLIPWRVCVPHMGERGAAIVLALLAIHFPLLSVAGFLMWDILFSALLAILFYFSMKNAQPWSRSDSFLPASFSRYPIRLRLTMFSLVR